ncbi:MAG: hypothetical protein Q8P32_00925 [Candidatus Komeilibacteria bacterium]|nr:hypothetical protein [Candidatus Komeilibacteria bacterium]
MSALTTSKGTREQKDSFFSLLKSAVSEAAKIILKEMKPSRAGLQILLANGHVFKAAIIKAVTDTARELLAPALSENASAYEFARLTLGRAFITPEEVMRARRGVVYTPEQLTEFKRILPTQDIIQWAKSNGFILVAGPAKPLSLLEIRDLDPIFFYAKSGDWYAGDAEKFSRDDKVDVTWLMVRKEAVQDSFSKSWTEQTALLLEVEYVPNVAEVAWAVTTYKAVRGIYLMPNFYVRTSSVDALGNRVPVGLFGASGLAINDCWDVDRHGALAVVSARKLKMES